MNLSALSKPHIRAITLIAVIIIFSIILSIKHIRFDLTSEKKYTLSDFTKETLSNLPDNIYIKVYLAGDDLPGNLQILKNAIKEQLEEFKVYGKDNFNYEFINPSESPIRKERFAIYEQLTSYGLFPFEAKEISASGKSSQTMVFPGAVISYKDKNLGINLLSATSGVSPESEVNVNNSIEDLEYRLTNGLVKVLRNKKPAIAFIEGQGELSEYEVMDMTRTLSEYYTVKRGKINSDINILNDFEAIIIAKPQKPFNEQDKYVIDQYLMRGGNILWLLEGTVTNLDSLFAKSYTISLNNNTELDDMLFNYGVRVNKNLIYDKYSAPIGIRMRGANGKSRIEMFPWHYFPVIAGKNKHLISKNLDYIRAEFVSSIDTLKNQKGVKKSVLLSSSNFSKKHQIPVRMELAQARRKYDDNYFNDGQQIISVLLEGNFESVFKFRTPQSLFPNKKIPAPISKSKYAKMIVVSDGDIIKNYVSPNNKPYPIGFDIFSKQQFKGNEQFILNAVNYLCEDGGLMKIRSRELKLRLLDIELIKNNRFLIQLINLSLPILLIIVFGFIILIIRKRKYN